MDYPLTDITVNPFRDIREQAEHDRFIADRLSGIMRGYTDLCLWGFWRLGAET